MSPSLPVLRPQGFDLECDTESSVLCCAFWATRTGCKLCLQQQQNGDEIPTKDPALAVRAGERTVLHGEILHEKGREK